VRPKLRNSYVRKTLHLVAAKIENGKVFPAILFYISLINCYTLGLNISIETIFNVTGYIIGVAAVLVGASRINFVKNADKVAHNAVMAIIFHIPLITCYFIILTLTSTFPWLEIYLIPLIELVFVQIIIYLLIAFVYGVFI
jgi:hypothetical protein